jgi:G3E family GTPase
VTTIGGYLGAGKTTLVNGLLSGDHGVRIGVLVNDFGAVSIDEKLIVARDEDVVSLANGCACCTIGDDLAAALDRFAGRDDRYDRIVIEASGVADPARVAALAQSPGLRRSATVVVADAATIRSRARDKFVGRLVQRQLAAADTIVLTKIDLVQAAGLDAARAFAMTQAPQARLLEIVHGRIATQDLFGHDAAQTRLPASQPAGEEPVFESHAWSTKKPADVEALRAAVTALPDSIVRLKGVIGTSTGRRVALHRAGSVVTIDPLAGEASGTEIVVIGRAGTLDRPRLDATFDACLLPPRISK